MNVDFVLREVKEQIKNEEELGYFLIHQVRYKKILSKIHTLSGGKSLKILDVGCFPYQLGKALEKLGHGVFGVSSYHEKVKRRDVEILNVEEEELPFEDSFFDLVLFTEVIEHLPKSPVFALREMRRVCKRGGFLIVTTPNVTRLVNRIKILFGKNIAYSIEDFFESEGRGSNLYFRHNREYVMSELSEVLERCGWKNQEKRYIISYTPFRRKLVSDPLWLFVLKLVNYFVVLFVPQFRDTLFVVAWK